MQAVENNNIVKQIPAINFIICPHCLGNNGKNDNLKKESLSLKCIKCEKKFTFINCLHCKRNISFKLETFTDGINIKCPYVDCKKWFNKTKCLECKQFIFFDNIVYIT